MQDQPEWKELLHNLEREPDWMRYVSPEEQYRDDMLYEENARYDRYDGYADPYIGNDFEDEQYETPAGYYPQPVDSWEYQAYRDSITVHDDVPF